MVKNRYRYLLNFIGIAILVIVFLLNSCSTSTLNQVIVSQSSPTILSTSASSPNYDLSTTQSPGYTPRSSLNPTKDPTPNDTLISPLGPQIPQPSTPTALSPDDWMTLPVIPTVSQTAHSIYLRGLEMGNDPHAFSKIGDCQSITTYFISYFDMPGYYDLGNYSSLQETIDWYSGSFSRESLAVKGGFNAAAILSPLRADPQKCNPNENPVECELRVHHPSVVIISLEEWWAGHPENYETYLRQIIDYTIQQGVVPILATKADNLEGNNLINQTIARFSNEYDIPLWNFWLAVQPLPDHGLMKLDASGEPDLFHLTHSEGYYFYNDPENMLSGWSMRNLTALQALDAVRRGLAQYP